MIEEIDEALLVTSLTRMDIRKSFLYLGIRRIPKDWPLCQSTANVGLMLNRVLRPTIPFTKNSAVKRVFALGTAN